MTGIITSSKLTTEAIVTEEISQETDSSLVSNDRTHSHKETRTIPDSSLVIWTTKLTTIN